MSYMQVSRVNNITMDVQVPETNKEEGVSVASPSNTNFERKIVMVTPKRVFYIYLKESEIIQPVQETGAPASAEFVK
jgi:hypothetical protein